MATYVGLVDRDRYPDVDLPDTDLIDASKAVLNYTDRDFLSTPVVEERIFVPSTSATTTGDLIVDIDDCDEIYDVDGFSSTQWRAGTDGPAASYGIFTYVEVRVSRPDSPLMGFTRNEDLFGTPWWGELAVTARWGWPNNTVPEDVQRATLIAAYEMANDLSTQGGNVSSETVAEVSRSYVVNPPTNFGAPETLPSRAIAILDPWRRKSL